MRIGFDSFVRIHVTMTAFHAADLLRLDDAANSVTELCVRNHLNLGQPIHVIPGVPNEILIENIEDLNSSENLGDGLEIDDGQRICFKMAMHQIIHVSANVELFADAETLDNEYYDEEMGGSYKTTILSAKWMPANANPTTLTVTLEDVFPKPVAIKISAIETRALNKADRDFRDGLLGIFKVPLDSSLVQPLDKLQTAADAGHYDALVIMALFSRTTAAIDALEKLSSEAVADGSHHRSTESHALQQKLAISSMRFRRMLEHAAASGSLLGQLALGHIYHYGVGLIQGKADCSSAVDMYLAINDRPLPMHMSKGVLEASGAAGQTSHGRVIDDHLYTKAAHLSERWLRGVRSYGGVDFFSTEMTGDAEGQGLEFSAEEIEFHRRAAEPLLKEGHGSGRGNPNGPPATRSTTSWGDFSDASAPSDEELDAAESAYGEGITFLSFL